MMKKFTLQLIVTAIAGIAAAVIAVVHRKKANQ